MAVGKYIIIFNTCERETITCMESVNTNQDKKILEYETKPRLVTSVLLPPKCLVAAYVRNGSVCISRVNFKFLRINFVLVLSQTML